MDTGQCAAEKTTSAESAVAFALLCVEMGEAGLADLDRVRSFLQVWALHQFLIFLLFVLQNNTQQSVQFNVHVVPMVNHERILLACVTFRSIFKK